MDCLSSIALVTWNASAGAEFYTATVTAEDDESDSETCMSSTQQCGIADLSCGRSYTVVVTASNQQCNSDPSTLGFLQSGEHETQ